MHEERRGRREVKERRNYVGVRVDRSVIGPPTAPLSPFPASLPPTLTFFVIGCGWRGLV
jgi:hypothetical protein